MPTCYGIETLKLPSACRDFDFGEHIIVICGHLRSSVVPKNAEITSNIWPILDAPIIISQGSEIILGYAFGCLCSCAVKQPVFVDNLSNQETHREFSSKRHMPMSSSSFHGPKLKVNKIVRVCRQPPNGRAGLLWTVQFLDLRIVRLLETPAASPLLSLSYWLRNLRYKFATGSNGGKADKPPLLMA